MPAAARVNDLTSHGGKPLGPGPGSANVMIGGQAAWRAAIVPIMGDVHQCPLFSSNVPHIGGVAMKGSTTVFINNLPAVRMGDKIQDLGDGPNQITSGCTSVNIGG